jgi:hypothetical protein
MSRGGPAALRQPSAWLHQRNSGAADIGANPLSRLPAQRPPFTIVATARSGGLASDLLLVAVGLGQGPFGAVDQVAVELKLGGDELVSQFDRGINDLRA